MELQEKVSQIKEDEIRPLKKHLNSQIKELLEKVALEFNNKNLQSSAQILIRAKYFDKTLRDLKEKNK